MELLRWASRKRKRGQDDDEAKKKEGEREEGVHVNELTTTVKRRKLAVADIISNVTIPKLFNFAKEAFLPIQRPPVKGDHIYVWRRYAYKHHGKFISVLPQC